MEKVLFGATGLKVSRIGMGGIPIVRLSTTEAVRLVEQVLDLGVNLIDTAAGYADSEEKIGRAIAPCRSSVIVATKGGGRTKDEVAKAIEGSLVRLGTDYIDIWQFHNTITIENLAATISEDGPLAGALAAVAEGKVRHVSFSSHRLAAALQAVDTGKFASVQFPLNFVAPEALPELLPLVRERKMGFLAMKPFAGGNIHSARLAISYLLQFEGVIPIPGIERYEEIQEIVALARSADKPGIADLAEMAQIRSNLGSIFCHQCMYCMPCPHGVVISMATYAKTLHRLWPMDLIVSKFGQLIETGQKCTSCGQCEPRCPYNLPIRNLIKENTVFYLEQKKAWESSMGNTDA